MNATSAVAWTALRHSLACASGLPGLSAVSSVIYVSNIQIQQPDSSLILSITDPINTGILAPCTVARARLLRAEQQHQTPLDRDEWGERASMQQAEHDEIALAAAQRRRLAPIGILTMMIVLRTTSATTATQ